jgi:threonine dehydrogenase-like Zn-dependent dehydrogenase
MSGPTPDNLEVRVAILGGGSMGATHTDSYSRINKVRVVGVFSRRRERAEAVARICRAKSVNDAFALLDDPAIDAIDVCVPSANHLEYVVAALERGKHVFCETPQHAMDTLKLSIATQDSLRQRTTVNINERQPLVFTDVHCLLAIVGLVGVPSKIISWPFSGASSYRTLS